MFNIIHPLLYYMMNNTELRTISEFSQSQKSIRLLRHNTNELNMSDDQTEVVCTALHKFG